MTNFGGSYEVPCIFFGWSNKQHMYGNFEAFPLRKIVHEVWVGKKSWPLTRWPPQTSYKWSYYIQPHKWPKINRFAWGYRDPTYRVFVEIPSGWLMGFPLYFCIFRNGPKWVHSTHANQPFFFQNNQVMGGFFFWRGDGISKLGAGFRIYSIFTPIWGRFPFWLIFFNWVETTS